MTAGTRVLRVGRLSMPWRPRPLTVGAGLVAVLVGLAAVAVSRGDFAVPLDRVVDVLGGGGSELDRLVVWQWRMPRVLTAVLVGFALGMSGAITQSVTRNPLASPDVLGITGGAGAAAVAVIVLSGGADGDPGVLTTWIGLPAAALAGGLLTAAAVYLLAWRGGVDGHRLVLIGIAIGALCAAVTAWLVIRAEINDAAQATVWLTGSVANRGWEHVVPVAVAVVLAGAGTLAAARLVDVLRFTEDTTRALGVRVQAGRATVVVLAVTLAAVATAAAGPITFVALVAPQLAVRLIRAPGPRLLTSALLGAVLLLAADLVARTVLPVELPVGVLTAILGAPYLLAMLLANARREYG